jgi:predicted membrane-bound spermidine synthase
MKTENGQQSINNHIYPGIFMIALATIALELLLPRIWSVTMWYHFAFVAISIAMFGITAGALLVFFYPQYFNKEQACARIALSSLLFSVSTVLGFLTQLTTPFFPDRSIGGVYSLFVICLSVAIPFTFSGIAISLALTQFPQSVGKVYAADLCGAAIGCLSVLLMLRVTDGPTSIIASALCASIGAVFLAIAANSQKLKKIGTVITIFLALFTVGNTIATNDQGSLLRLMWVNAKFEPRPLCEKWNSFSRVAVQGDPNYPEPPRGWGLSSTYPKSKRVRQLSIVMDCIGATFIHHFDGDFKNLDFLKYDLVNLPHYLRKNAKVLIIGTGGGREVLSALAFSQQSVTGVEINEEVLKMVTERFGEFAGHFDRDPRVRLVNDEARSFIARQNPGYDIIQISAIDTGMATGAGAYALTENSLYTVEAWQLFLEKLSPSGILSCSRWFSPRLPGEIYRLAALSREALKRTGIEDAQKCVVIVRQKLDQDDTPVCATILVSKQGFSKDDLDILSKIAQKLQFEIELSPNQQGQSVLNEIISATNLKELTNRLPVRIDPPTDDSPYFFYVIKPWRIFNTDAFNTGIFVLYSKAQVILFALAIVVVILTVFSMIIPIVLQTNLKDYAAILPDLAFFALIGLGFMFIEVSQLQRLIIFLGHPSYSLSVVLFTLLLSSGIGSYLTNLITTQTSRVAVMSLTILIALLIAYGLLTPSLLTRYAAASTPLRILIAAGILSPLGLFMGTAMPFGLRLASARNASLAPWFWGVNGATSVLASVLTIVVAISSGISTAYWAGTIAYSLALISLVISNKRRYPIESTSN